VAELHADVCAGLPDPVPGTAYSVLPAEPEAPPPCDVAVIGLSCFYPKAGGLWPYWENILAQVNAVVEIPPTHWDWRPYYDPDPGCRSRPPRSCNSARASCRSGRRTRSPASS